jgi:predicted metal-dependent hydrolase
MKKTISYSYNDKTYQIDIHRRKMRRIIFRVRDGRIIISAPKYISLREIRKNLQKIFHRLLEQLENESPLHYRHVYYLGVKHYVSDLDHIAVFKCEFDNFLTDEFTKLLSSMALSHFKKRVTHYEKVMNITKPYKVKVKKMVSRLATNSRRTHTLTFALKLIHYSEAIIDAVVVHELAHHFQFNHSKAFYQIVNKYYPDYEKEHHKIKVGRYA